MNSRTTTRTTADEDAIRAIHQRMIDAWNAGDGAAVAVLHPLDPLTADEIRAAVAVVRASGRLGREVLFIRIELREPPKSAVLAFGAGDPLEREAFLLIRDRRAPRSSSRSSAGRSCRGRRFPVSSRPSPSTSSLSASGACRWTRRGRQR
jgi:Copper amine oxidase, N2 domain